MCVCERVCVSECVSECVCVCVCVCVCQHVAMKKLTQYNTERKLLQGFLHSELSIPAKVYLSDMFYHFRTIVLHIMEAYS